MAAGKRLTKDDAGQPAIAVGATSRSRTGAPRRPGKFAAGTPLPHKAGAPGPATARGNDLPVAKGASPAPRKVRGADAAPTRGGAPGPATARGSDLPVANGGFPGPPEGSRRGRRSHRQRGASRAGHCPWERPPGRERGFPRRPGRFAARTPLPHEAGPRAGHSVGATSRSRTPSAPPACLPRARRSWPAQRVAGIDAAEEMPQIRQRDMLETKGEIHEKG